MEEETGKLLSERNKHIRDELILFNEEWHKYYLQDEDNLFVSVTTFISQQYPMFSSDQMIRKMMAADSFVEGHKWFGYTFEEIQKSWDDNKRECSCKGRELHKAIELFYNTKFEFGNQGYLEHAIKSKYRDISGWENFIDFLRMFKNFTLVPFRSEWIVFDKDCFVAGTVDMLFENEDGSLDMYDWKRVKKLPSRPYSLEIKATSYWHYTLQQNIYKWIIEKNYGYKIRKMFLVQLHPDSTTKIHQVKEIQREVEEMMMERKMKYQSNTKPVE